jgi:hypothetical protein
MRRYFVLTALALLAAGRAGAQAPSYREDLRFAEALRARGDNDLALEFLKTLARNAPPELAKELPLEFAKTSLRVAAEEPEAARRLAYYKEARENFQKFIDANPGHPRVAEANVDIARVLNLQGKTELGQALLTEDAKSKKEIAATARKTLQEAATKLQAAEKVLAAAVEATPDPDTITDAKKKKEAQAARFQAEDALKQVQFEHALNLYDQANTYLEPGSEAASKLLEKAESALGPLAGGNPAFSITWKARAWLGRIFFEIRSAPQARAKYQEVLAGSVPAAQDGIRLARYFRLLAIREKPDDADKKKGINGMIIEAAERWRRDYPRFHKTPEGFGLSFLLARTLLEEAATNKKAPGEKYRNDARNLLREVESSENEYTDQARRLKIQTMFEQGLFKVRIERLRTFEDCYVRAQFEISQLAKDPPEKRKDRVETILAVLRRGLAMPEVKKMKASLELNTARTTLAYWALSTGQQQLADPKTTDAALAHLNEAITVGETFARTDPRSSQAEMSAVYALGAYGTLYDYKKSKFEDAAEDRARLFSLAHYMEERWPRGAAGDKARHMVGVLFLKDGNFAEGIKKLSLISPSYDSFILARYLLATNALKADQDSSIEPIAGDRPGDYRKRALAALQSMPDSALGPNPITNELFIAGKAILGRELFKFKRYQQMDDLANGLLGRLASLRFSDDDEKDRGTRNQLRYELVDLTLFARYGLADQAFQAGDHKRAAELLDGMIDRISKEENSQERSNLQKNPQLATAMLSIALKANILLGKVDRTEVVLDVLDKVTTEAGEANTTNILKLLAFLIRGQVEEVRKKGDKEELDKAIKNYSAILEKRIKKQKNLTPEFIRVLADCYSSMDEHEKAAAELAKVPEPKGKGNPDEERNYRAVQVTLARELRLSKTKENLQKARTVVDGLLGTKQKPNWGSKDIYVLKEHGKILEAEEKYSDGFKHWAYLTRNLAKKATQGGQNKENYLECYYHMVFCYLKLGLAEPTRGKRDNAIHTAAVQIAALERSWEDFGSDASKKRFTALLESDRDLKEQYEAAKKATKKQR